MSNDELRIAIAELLGWTGIHADGPDGPYLGRPKWSDDPDTVLLPDYPNDLNAMHEAEKTLTERQWYKYREIMSAMIGAPRHSLEIRKFKEWFHSTAEQRARAFVAAMREINSVQPAA